MIRSMLTTVSIIANLSMLLFVLLIRHGISSKAQVLQRIKS
jgi:hypothetical protein